MKKNYYFNLLKNFCSINSQTKNSTAVQQVQNLMSQQATDHNLFHAFYKNETHQSADLLVIGNQRDLINNDITLISHSDIALPTDFKFTGSITSEKISSIGVGDNKASLVIALRALNLFKEKYPDALTAINWIISPNEETGSNGLHQAMKTIGRNSKVLLGLEPAIDGKDIAISRRGNRWYKIQVKGDRGHSGRNVNELRNAGFEAARIINELDKLRSKIPGTSSISIGGLNSGHNFFNVTCDKVIIKVDIRFASKNDREFIHENIYQILDSEVFNNFYCIEDDCPSMDKNINSLALAENYAVKLQKIEKQNTEVVPCLGAADINYIADDHHACLDGIGAITFKMHAQDEFIYTDSLWTRSQALFEFFEEFELNLRERGQLNDSRETQLISTNCL